MKWLKKLSERVDSLADPNQTQHDDPKWELTKADEKARQAREAEAKKRGH